MSLSLNQLWWDWLRHRVVDLSSTSLTGAATGTGSASDFAGRYSGVSVYAECSPGASAGVLKIETAPSLTYAGAWHELASINISANKTIFTRVAGAFLAVRGRISTVLAGTIGAAVFTGAGLDDATSGGAYVLAPDAVFEVEIDLADTTDTFKWRKDGGAYTAGVALTGSAQTLSDGVQVTFGATTGHTLGDKWTITALGGRVTVTLVKEP